MRAKFSPHILLKTMPCLTKNVAQNLYPYQVSQSLPRSGKALIVTKNMAKMEPFLQFSIEINNPFHLRRRPPISDCLISYVNCSSPNHFRHVAPRILLQRYEIQPTPRQTGDTIGSTLGGLPNPHWETLYGA